MTDPHQPPTSDPEAMSAIAKVLGHADPRSQWRPPPPPTGGESADAEDPSPRGQAPGGPAEPPPSAGPSSIVLRPTGADAPVAVTRRHLYTATAAAVIAAALIAAGVAALVAGNDGQTAAAATPGTETPPTTTASSSTSTSSTSTSTTLPPPVELSTGTLTLPYPATKAGVTAFGAIAKPGELVVAPKQSLIKGAPGSASWQWETCTGNDCTLVEGANGEGYRVPAAAPAGSTVRAVLTITPEGQTGQVKVRSKRILITTS